MEKKLPLTTTCNGCGKIGSRKEFQVCSRCRWTRYCGPDCQRKDWRSHKTLCKSNNVDVPRVAKIIARVFINWVEGGDIVYEPGDVLFIQVLYPQILERVEFAFVNRDLDAFIKEVEVKIMPNMLNILIMIRSETSTGIITSAISNTPNPLPSANKEETLQHVVDTIKSWIDDGTVVYNPGDIIGTRICPQTKSFRLYCTDWRKFLSSLDISTSDSALNIAATMFTKNKQSVFIMRPG